MTSSEARGSGRFRSLGRIRRKGVSRGAIIGWFAAFLGAVSGAAALGDNSFFTHLTTGRRILDGHLPSTDPYSFTAYGHPWVIQSWFASLLYGLGDKVGHGMGIRLMVAALSALLAVLLWRLTLAADQGRRIDGVVAGANMDTGFITIEVEPSAVSGTQIRQRAIVVLLAVDKAGPPS